MVESFADVDSGENGELLVSGLACKDLGSHHLHPHNKEKAEQAKNQQPFLGPSENWGHGANYRSQNRGDRCTQRVTA